MMVEHFLMPPAILGTQNPKPESAFSSEKSVDLKATMVSLWHSIHACRPSEILPTEISSGVQFLRGQNSKDSPQKDTFKKNHN